MKTVLIFGCSGQLGSYLAETYLNKGFKVVAAIRRVSTTNLNRIVHLVGNPNFVLDECDICDFPSLMRIFSQHDPDVCINCAAQSHVATSFVQPGLTWQVVAEGCLNILEVIRQLSPYTKFVQLSSSEMFGSILDKDGYQRETTIMQPNSPYAIAKLAAHRATQLYRSSYGLWASCAICFNMESPRRQEFFVTRKITKYCGWLVREKQRQKVGWDKFLLRNEHKLKLGNLDAKRDWSYCGDSAEGIFLLSEQDEPDDFVFGTGETHSVREFLDAAFKRIGVDNWSGVVEVDRGLLRPQEVPELRADASKARSVLGWMPKYNFLSLVELMVDKDSVLPASY